MASCRIALMHLYAYRHREDLQLNEIECLVTRSSIRAHLIYVSTGVASILLTLLGSPALGGLVYFLIGPAHFVNGFMSGTKIDRLAKAAGSQ